MAKRYSSEDRVKIVREHMADFDGIFRPADFVEVARSENHPAHDYFEWDNSAAAHQHRLWQARQFAKITIKRPAVEMHDLTSGKVKLEYRPSFVAPIGRRAGEGGYVSTDTPEGEAALEEEAGAMLRQWFFRFSTVMSDKQEAAARRLMKLFPEPEQPAD